MIEALRITVLAGASLGLLEATWVLERKTGPGAAALVLADAAVGYALVSLLAALAWCLVMPKRTREPGWALGAAIPPALLVGLAVIGWTWTTESRFALLVRLVAALAVGIQAVFLARGVASRLPFLGRASTWWGVQAATILVAAALLLLRQSDGGPAVASAGAKPPNVLLVTVDTLRADHVGSYGHPTIETPNMDALARDGVRFLETVSASPLTCPSHTSILTGLDPLRHGAVHNGKHPRADSRTLAETLRDEGYRTAAFVSGYTLKDDACGLGARFETWSDDFSPYGWLPDNALKLRLGDVAARVARGLGTELRRLDRPAGRTTDDALRWLEGAGDEPFFLWIHYFDPHQPYEPPPPYDRLYGTGSERFGHWYFELSNEAKERLVTDPAAVRRMSALYDGEIRYTDEQIGRVRDALERLGLAERTIVVLTSDHGESLGEHDYWFEHSNYLYEEELRVPLIVSIPGLEAATREVGGQTRLIDVAPTILDALGVPPEEGTQGRTLLPRMTGAPADDPRPSFAGVPEGAWESGRSIYALRHHGYKLVWTSAEWRFYGMRIPPREELYDLERDPGELENLVDEAPPVLDEMRDALAQWRATSRDSGESLSEDVRRSLRSLGYLQ